MEHLDAQFLRSDSARQNDKIKTLYKILEVKDNQMNNWNERVTNKEQEVVAMSKLNYHLTEKYNKSQKWQKFFRNTTVIFISTTVILTGVLFIAR